MINIDTGYDKFFSFFTRNSYAHWQVLFGITNPELYILDMFEDVEYEKSVVEASLLVSYWKPFCSS